MTNKSKIIIALVSIALGIALVFFFNSSPKAETPVVPAPQEQPTPCAPGETFNILTGEKCV